MEINRKQRRQNKKYERYIGTKRENRIHRGFTKPNQKEMNLQSEISKILNETIVRTCNLFGGSLSDLEPEDQEIEVKATDAILALIKKHERELIGEDERNCEDGKSHKWETHPTDSGAETYCTKCFLNGLVPYCKNKLRAELRAKLKEVGK